LGFGSWDFPKWSVFEVIYYNPYYKNIPLSESLIPSSITKIV
jgi:hypothetical protein